MTLPASGPLSLNDIANEFSGRTYPSNYSFAGRNIQFSDYAYNGGYIPNDGSIHSMGQPLSFSMFLGKTDYSITTKGLWMFGSSGNLNTSSLIKTKTTVNENGTISSDVSITSAAVRENAAGLKYGGGPVMIWAGRISSTQYSTVYTKLDSLSTFISDYNFSGTARQMAAGLTYGFDKGIFYGGSTPGIFFGYNLITSSGVVGSDTTFYEPSNTTWNGGRRQHAGLTYGGNLDKGIFAFGGGSSGSTNSFQLISNTGVVGSSQNSVASANYIATSCGYGGDKGYFFRQGKIETRNAVTFDGIIGSDSESAFIYADNQKRGFVYAGAKAIMGYGNQNGTSNFINTVNYITSVGVIGTSSSTTTTARVNSTATDYGT